MTYQFYIFRQQKWEQSWVCSSHVSRTFSACCSSSVWHGSSAQRALFSRFSSFSLVFLWWVRSAAIIFYLRITTLRMTCDSRGAKVQCSEVDAADAELIWSFYNFWVNSTLKKSKRYKFRIDRWIIWIRQQDNFKMMFKIKHIDISISRKKSLTLIGSTVQVN